MNSIRNLPDENLMHCFSFLEVRDLATLNSVCTRWHRISNDEFLWKHLCMQTFAAMSIPVTPSQGWKSFFKMEHWMKHLANPSFIPKSTTIQLKDWQDELNTCWILNGILVIARNKYRYKNCSFFLRNLKSKEEIEVEGYSYSKFTKKVQYENKLFFLVDNCIFELDVTKRNLNDVRLVKLWQSETKIYSFAIEGKTLVILTKSFIELIDLKTFQCKKIEKKFRSPIKISITKKYIVVETRIKKALFDREQEKWKLYHAFFKLHISSDGEVYFYRKNIFLIRDLAKKEFVYSNHSRIINFYSTSEKIVTVNKNKVIHIIDRKSYNSKKIKILNSYKNSLIISNNVALLSEDDALQPISKNCATNNAFLDINTLEVLRVHSFDGECEAFSKEFCVFQNFTDSFTILDFSFHRKREFPCPIQPRVRPRMPVNTSPLNKQLFNTSSEESEYSSDFEYSTDFVGSSSESTAYFSADDSRSLYCFFEIL